LFSIGTAIKFWQPDGNNFASAAKASTRRHLETDREGACSNPALSCARSQAGTDVTILNNIFAKKIGEKVGDFDSKHCRFLQKLYLNIGF
jgi:hypothetical protein